MIVTIQGVYKFQLDSDNKGFIWNTDRFYVNNLSLIKDRTDCQKGSKQDPNIIMTDSTYKV